MSERGLIDYHVHSNFSFDGKSTIYKICQKAIELGIREIGFAEHMDFEPADMGYGFFDYDKYTLEISNACLAFGDQLVIRKGVEVDYQHCFEDEVRGWLRGKEFDFVIGSVHYIDHRHISQLIKRRSLEWVVEGYVDEVLHSIRSGLFDVVGHLATDYIRHLSGEDSAEYSFMDRARKVLQEIRDNDLYLEINTKELRGEYKETVPSRRLVKEYAEEGGRLFSVGSDAHSAKDVGQGIREVMGFLEKLDGCTLRLIFE